MTDQQATFIDGPGEQNTLLIDIATRDVIRLASGHSLAEAAAIMRQRRISSIVVTDEADHPVGIVTERNILQAMQDGRSGESALHCSPVRSSPCRSPPSRWMPTNSA